MDLRVTSQPFRRLHVAMIRLSSPSVSKRVSRGSLSSQLHVLDPRHPRLRSPAALTPAAVGNFASVQLFSSLVTSLLFFNVSASCPAA